MYVNAELLASTRTVRRRGHEIHVTLPATMDDFGLMSDFAEPALGGGTQKDDKWISRSVTLMRLSVDLELPDSATDDSPNRATIDEVHGLLGSAADVARKLLHEYIDLVRTRQGQYWLGHSAQSPRVTWLTTVVDRETGGRIRIGYNDPITVVRIGDERALSVADHEETLEAVETGSLADLPELLLADARHLAWSSEPQQYREAVLMAAVAAEIKIKETLHRVCPEPGRSILAFALRNPRDVSVQAASLYDKAAEAVTGRSLRKEDFEAYKALERLFVDRNAVAHRAQPMRGDEVRNDLIAAGKALQWADTLETQQ